jgi:hypothetical protein
MSTHAFQRRRSIHLNLLRSLALGIVVLVLALLARSHPPNQTAPVVGNPVLVKEFPFSDDLTKKMPSYEWRMNTPSGNLFGGPHGPQCWIEPTGTDTQKPEGFWFIPDCKTHQNLLDGLREALLHPEKFSELGKQIINEAIAKFPGGNPPAAPIP